MEEKSNKVIWESPLPGCFWSLPCGKYNPAGFGARRKYSLHTGIDLFCAHMQPLASVEDGIVVAIKPFSKNKNKSHYKAILIEGEDEVVAYCGVQQRTNLKVGDLVCAGEIIGNVINSNKKKRKKDTCVLHLELYKKGTTKTAIWSYNFPKPPHLLDPNNKLLSIITDNQIIYKKRKSIL